MQLELQFKTDMEEGFDRFHQRNPGVFVMLVKLARDLQDRGHKKYGIAGLFEVIRWQVAMDTERDEVEPFKLNNNYRAFYARKIMREVPRLNGFFEIRRQISKI